MTPAQVLDLAHKTWPLPWQIDGGGTDLPVVCAEVGALTVAIAITTPLVVIGSLGEEEFFETEAGIDELPATLLALEQSFRELVTVPALA